MFSGCASVLSERKYAVTFDNAGGPTYFAVADRKQNVIHQGVTPQQVTLDAKAFPFWPAKYQVSFAGQEGFTHEQEIKAGFDPWIAGNILLGGVAGTIVDGATGAMFKLPGRVDGQVPAQYAMTDVTQGAAVIAANTKKLETAEPNESGVKQVQHEQTAAATESSFLK